MARATLLHLARAQTSHHLKSTNFYFHSGYHSCRPATWLHTPGAKTNLKPATQLAIAQKRWASQCTPAEDGNKISIGPRRGEAGDNEDTGLFITAQSQVLSRK